jgi:RHS repeat-associated protein
MIVAAIRIVQEFTYRDPYFDSAKQEFRGFAYAEVRALGDASAPTKLTRHWFDTGETVDCLKGRLLKQEVLTESESLFTRMESDWSHRVLASGTDQRDVCFAFNEKDDTWLYEGTQNPTQLQTGYAYDDYGNVIATNNYGIVDGLDLSVGDDEVLTSTDFIVETNGWILNRAWREQITDLGGAPQAEKRFYYDDLPLQQVVKGNLTCTEELLDTEARYIPTIRNGYDAFGNVIQITDANGHMRTITYDPQVHAYPTSEIVHLESSTLSMAVDYDLGFGTVASSTDFAGAVTTYAYDPLARPLDIFRPGGAEEQFEYNLASPVSSVIRRVRENLGGGTYDTYSYFDGYGRSLGSKAEAENGQWRYLDATSYNSRKLEQRKWLPYHTSTSDFEAPDPAKPGTDMQYDVKDRVTRSTNSDGTYARNVYLPLIHQVFDENDNADGLTNPMSYRTDGRELLVEVIERNQASTSYIWDTRGDLVQITDAQNNVKTLAYDSLKRKVSMNDPNRGVMAYAYDDVGNLTQTTDAKGQVITYAYDFANRLLAENYLDQGGGPGDPVDVAYVYDTPSTNLAFGDGSTGTATFTGARLASVIDLTGEEHFSYDARGNVLWTVKRIRDPILDVLVPYSTQFAYDVMDRMTDVIYPDNDHVRYTHNSASFVETIDGGVGGRTILSNIDYEATQQQSLVAFGNGVTTSYGYDDRIRLDSLLTNSPIDGEIIHYTYSYDPVSNITKIADNRPAGLVPLDSPRRNTQVFDYDELYRLTRVRYAPVSDNDPTLGQIDYTYDALGNMLSKSSPAIGQPGHIDDDERVNLGVMNYAGGRFGRIGRSPGDPPGPHALTDTANGGVYTYDDNGNMTSIEGATCTWDFKDRLVRYQKGTTDAHYRYDHTDRRIAKKVTENGRTDQTLYINKYFEIRPNRAPVKYVFNGDARIAQVKGTLDPTRPRLQRIWLVNGWNSVCVAVETTQTLSEIFGSDAAVYGLSGDDYVFLANSTVPSVGQALWVDVPTPRVVTAMGTYAENPPSFALGADRQYLGWPRLEPFLPAAHVQGVVNLALYDAFSSKWLMQDAAAPSFTLNLPDALPAATCFWASSLGSELVAPAVSSDADVLFYHSDHLGSTNTITNLIGSLVGEVCFYAFGGMRREYRSESIGLLIREHYDFTGKERDFENALIYFEARYFTPYLGRFVSVDPMVTAAKPDDRLRHPQQVGTYAYCANKPIHHLDPTGKYLVSVITTVYDLANAAVKIEQGSFDKNDAKGMAFSFAFSFAISEGSKVLAKKYGYKVIPVYGDAISATLTIHGIESDWRENEGIPGDVRRGVEFVSQEVKKPINLFGDIGEASHTTGQPGLDPKKGIKNFVFSEGRW